MKKLLRPYVSVDIETTGLDKESEILQIAAVFDDLVSPIKDLETFNMTIKHEKFRHSEPYALVMNAKLIEKMTRNENVYPSWTVANKFIDWLSEIAQQTYFFDTDNNLKMKGKIQFAGKNVANFDIPMLSKFMQEQGLTNQFDLLKTHRTIDVGSLYLPDFGYNVSLSEINQLLDRPEVSHDALDDAMDVVVAIRHKLGVKNE